MFSCLIQLVSALCSLSPGLALQPQTFCQKLCVHRTHHWTHPTSDSAVAHNERIRRNLIFEIQEHIAFFYRGLIKTNFQVSVIASDLSSKNAHTGFNFIRGCYGLWRQLSWRSETLLAGLGTTRNTFTSVKWVGIRLAEWPSS